MLGVLFYVVWSSSSWQVRKLKFNDEHYLCKNDKPTKIGHINRSKSKTIKDNLTSMFYREGNEKKEKRKCGCGKILFSADRRFPI